MVAGSRHKLRIERRSLPVQLRQLIYSGNIQLLVRGAERIKMVVDEIALVVIPVKAQCRIQLIAVPEAYLIHVEGVRLIALAPQQPRQARQLTVSEAGGHRKRADRIDRCIAHKLGIRRVARANLLIDLREIKALSRQAVQHRRQLLSVQ